MKTLFKYKLMRFGEPAAIVGLNTRCYEPALTYQSTSECKCSRYVAKAIITPIPDHKALLLCA